MARRLCFVSTILLIYLAVCGIHGSMVSTPSASILHAFMNATAQPAHVCDEWCGLQFDSTLGYPGEGPVSSEAEAFTAEQQAWLADCEKEQRLVEAMAVVKSVSFIYSDVSFNLNKVQATVWCCWDGARRSFKQVPVACHETERPTHLEALVALRAKLEREHACAGHQWADRAVQQSGRADRTRQRHRTPRRDAQQFRAEFAVNESKPRKNFASGGKPPAAPAAGSGSLRSPGSDVRSSGGP